MNIVFFEDHEAWNFEPLAFSHPVYMLLSGTSKIYSKWLQGIRSKDHSFLCRPHLAPLLEYESKKPVNRANAEDSLFINGRFLPSKNALKAVKNLEPGQSLSSNDALLAFRIGPGGAHSIHEHLLRLFEPDAIEKVKGSLKEIKILAGVVNHLWDLVAINSEFIAGEFDRFKAKSPGRFKVHSKACLIDKDNIFLGPGVEIGPQVVIDAADGPVIIESRTVVEPLSFIKGPAYIGPDCRIVGGKIREGSSLGPVCRVGGEVEETIMLGYCNKYHEGFLGHAYLGEWVNLGAMTTNSDLKNNYSNISVVINGKAINTGRLKVGCFIGDHTKTGIGTLLNTGISIGFSCNLYGGTLFTERSIQSFSWGAPGNLVEYRLDKAAETAAASMKRRNVQFTDAHRLLFESIRGLAKQPRI
jgi:UDP-N-acetylglucosamine diphosphorylase/glucosamine-1-phosphate N-acetyltransferase